MSRDQEVGRLGASSDRAGALRAEPAAQSQAKPLIADAGHTKGPWAHFANTDLSGFWIDTALGTDSDNGTIIADNICGKQAVANARLIAAAPELLEALRQVVVGVETTARDAHQIDARKEAEANPGSPMALAYAAIAKATGAA